MLTIATRKHGVAKHATVNERASGTLSLEMASVSS